MGLAKELQTWVPILLFIFVLSVIDRTAINVKPNHILNRTWLDNIKAQNISDERLFKLNLLNSILMRIYKANTFVHMLQSTETYSNKTQRRRSSKRTTVNVDETIDYPSNSSVLLEDEVEFNPRARTDGYKLGKPEDTPYAVLLNMYSVSSERVGGCSGTLVTLEWVLTAGHCLSMKHKLLGFVMVYAGGNSQEELLSNKLAPGAQVSKSTELYPHPLYGRYNADYDVGVLKVDPAFQSTTTVRVIKLSTDQWPYRGYQPCLLAGYGRVYADKSHVDDFKRKEHNLNLKSPCICQFRLKQLYGQKTASKLVCSQPRQDFGVCPGDSGGGMVCGGELRAVVSAMAIINPKRLCVFEILARIECGTQFGMNVFMNTCPFVRWINSHVALFNDTSIPDECHDWGVSGAQRCQLSCCTLTCLVANLLLTLQIFTKEA